MKKLIPDNLHIYNRTITAQITKYLGDDCIIVIHGARQLGKTHILYLVAKEIEKRKQKYCYVDLEDPLMLETLNKGHEGLLTYIKGEGHKENEDIYVLIDEIQYLNNPSSFLKIIVDHYKYIHLIVSGSSTFAVKSKFTDSLAGRTVDFIVYPLSFEEFLNFKNVQIDLKQATSPAHIQMLKALYTEFAMYGGYPKIVLTNEIEKKEVYLRQIIDTYIRKDIRDLGNIQDIDKFNKLLVLLASQSGNLLSMVKLSKELSLSIPTLEKYLLLLQETYIIKLVTPYSNNPNVELVKAPKVFFYDSGLASLLWLKSFPNIVVGSVFETSVFSELVKRYGVDKVAYWRTKSKQEIDFILKTHEDGMQKTLPIEVKMNFAQFDASAINSFNAKYQLPRPYGRGMLKCSLRGKSSPVSHDLTIGVLSEHYKQKDYKVIGLEGNINSTNFSYPWQ